MLSAALTILLASSPAPVAWYDREACLAVQKLILALDFTKAHTQISTLEKSTDLEDVACSLWSAVTLYELEMTIYGATPERRTVHQKALARLGGFSKQKARSASHFADLEIEARTRRVRALSDMGEKVEALKEIQRVKDLLQERKREPSSTLTYVTGITNMAVAHASWPMRTLLKLSGVDGEADVGKKLLGSLGRGASVYAFESRYMLHWFNGEEESKDTDKPSVWSERARRDYPANVQFVFEHAHDLQREVRCGEAMETIAPVKNELAANPQAWSEPIRAKVYWILARCSRDLGKNEDAVRWVKLAAQHTNPGYQERIAALQDELDD